MIYGNGEEIYRETEIEKQSRACLALLLISAFMCFKAN